MSPGIELLFLFLSRGISDIAKKILTYLDYEELEKLAEKYKEIRVICNNGYFWKLKILEEFNKNVDNIPIERLRAKYLFLYADYLEQRAEYLTENILQLSYPDRTIDRRNFPSIEINDLKSSDYETQDKITAAYGKDFTEKIQTRVKCLRKKSKDFSRLAEAIDIVTRDDKLITIQITENQLKEFSKIDLRNISIIQTFLTENSLYMDNLRAGNFIVFKYSKDKITDIPRTWLYVEESEGQEKCELMTTIYFESEESFKLSYMWAENLPESLLERYPIKNFIRTYKILFTIIK